jgi:hypothetical protein
MQSRSGTAFVIVTAAVILALPLACATTSDTYGDADSGITAVDPTQTSDGSVDANPASKKDCNVGGGDDATVTDPGTDASSCVKAPPSNACGVAPQCGCLSTETCDVTDNLGNVACISAGTAGLGKGCTTTAGCALGLTCAGKVCRPYCPAGTAKNAACGITGTDICFYAPDGSNNPIPNYHVCQISCDPLNPTSCDAAPPPGVIIGCDIDTTTSTTDCIVEGTLKDTDATNCDATNLCAPGYVCATVSAANNCKKWCKVGDNTPCGGGKTCGGFNPKVMVNTVEYGACP